MHARTLCSLAAMACAGLLLGLSISPTDAAIVKAQCDKGESLQERLDNKAKEGDTVIVSGTCVESVVINKDRVTLDCGLVGSIVGSGAVPTALVVSAGDVVITGCDISAGDSTISTITVIRNGAARITGNTVTGVGSVSGVTSSQGGYARVVGNTISGRTGVLVSGNSVMDIADNDITATRTGIFVGNGSAADIVGNTVTDLTLNAGGFSNGVFVTRQATANFSNDVTLGADPNIIQGFTRGIQCRDNSTVRIGVLQDAGTGNVQNSFFEGAPAGCSVQIPPSLNSDGFLPPPP